MRALCLRLALYALCVCASCSQRSGAGPDDPAGVPAAPAPVFAGKEAAPAASPGPEEHLSKVIAEVNGVPVYRAFYEQHLNYIRGRLPAGQDASSVERYIGARFEALDRVIDDELLYQEARKEGVTVSEPEVLAEFNKAAAAAGGEQQFVSVMRKQGISRYEAIEGMRRRLTVNKYIQDRLTSGLTVTEEEMLDYYNANVDRFTPEAWVKLFEISILCPRSAPPDLVTKARERAGKILANIRAGEPFETMAKEFSEDRNGPMGGNLGFVKRGATYPEFDAVIFSMKPGEVSEVIRTDDGFHILKVAERRGGTPVPFERSREECRRAVMNRKQSDIIQQVTSRLRAEAKIVDHLE